eukprot:sb/3468241/
MDWVDLIVVRIRFHLEATNFGQSWKTACVVVYKQVKLPKDLLATTTISPLELFTNFNVRQITYQLKTLTTALCSVGLLGRRISGAQWFSLCLLAAGVGLVQWKDPVESADSSSSSSSMIGLGAIACASLTSGFAGVSFELMLKSSSKSVWLRNVQLALCSCILGLGNIALTQQEHITEKGVFHDFNGTIAAVILSQAYGGLLISLVVKYTDNIVKVFATSISIILSSLITIFYLGELSFTMTFGGGLFLVVSASMIYSTFPAKAKAE